MQGQVKENDQGEGEKPDGHSEQSKGNSNGKQQSKITGVKKGKPVKNFEFKDNLDFTSKPKKWIKV